MVLVFLHASTVHCLCYCCCYRKLCKSAGRKFLKRGGRKSFRRTLVVDDLQDLTVPGQSIQAYNSSPKKRRRKVQMRHLIPRTLSLRHRKSLQSSPLASTTFLSFPLTQCDFYYCAGQGSGGARPLYLVRLLDPQRAVKDRSACCLRGSNRLGLAERQQLAVVCIRHEKRAGLIHAHLNHQHVL